MTVRGVLTRLESLVASPRGAAAVFCLAPGAAYLPFFRAFTTDHIVSPANGPASRKLAAAVEQTSSLQAN